MTCSFPLSRCVDGFGYFEYLHKACINTYYLHHSWVLKWLEIAFQCVVAVGMQPAVFGIYSTCRAVGRCTQNLYHINITKALSPQTSKDDHTLQ